MNKRTKIALFFSGLFLFCVFVIYIDGASPYLKSIYFFTGAVLLAFAVISSLIQKHRKGLIIGGALLAGYLLVFTFCFQTVTLDALMPDGDVTSVTVYSEKANGLLDWRLQKGTIEYHFDDEPLHVESTGINSEQVKNITLRNYWLPGSVDNSSIELFIWGDSNDKLTIFGYPGYISINSKRAGEAIKSNWVAYDDILSILPPDVLELLR